MKQILDSGPIKFLIGILVLYVIFVYLVPAACAQSEEGEEENGFCTVGKKIAELIGNMVDLFQSYMQYGLIIAGIGAVAAISKGRFKNLRRVDKAKNQPEGTEADKRLRDEHFDKDGKPKEGVNPDNDPRMSSYENFRNSLDEDGKRKRGVDGGDGDKKRNRVSFAPGTKKGGT